VNATLRGQAHVADLATDRALHRHELREQAALGRG
jgi:hypothetical protein